MCSACWVLLSASSFPMNCHESTSFTRNFCRQYCPRAAEELKKVCSFKTRKPQTKPKKLHHQSQEYRTDSSDATDAELFKSLSLSSPERRQRGVVQKKTEAWQRIGTNREQASYLCLPRTLAIWWSLGITSQNNLFKSIKTQDLKRNTIALKDSDKIILQRQILIQLPSCSCITTLNNRM